MSISLKTCFNSLNISEKSRLLPSVSYGYVYLRNLSNVTTKTDEKLTETASDIGDREDEIEKIRDKSRLKPYHRNILFDKKPYSEPMTESHLTVKYNRMMYGRYGSVSGVNPGIMWPTKIDLELRKEYEKVAQPFNIQEMVESAKKEIEIKELEIQKNQELVISKLKKLDLWKKELKEKIAKREAEALAAKEKKERLIEEVRRHFGFTVDPREERFKEMLAVREKEQKKREKQARLEEKERKAVAKLMERNK